MQHVTPSLAMNHRAMMPEETLPERAIRMAMHDVLDGVSFAEAAHRHGLSVEQLRAAIKGMGEREPGEPGASRTRAMHADRRKLTVEQERAVHAMVRATLPDAIGYHERLWSREAVRWLVQKETGVWLPERTLSTYLERWGFFPEKPMRTMAAAQPARMREWLKRDYPVIAMLANDCDGRIAWWGSAPLLARHHGKLPAGVKSLYLESPLWEAGRFNVLFITTNRGHARWLVHEGQATAAMIMDLLERVIADDPRKLHLIVPPDAVFTSPDFVGWAMRRKEQFSFHLFQAMPIRSAR